MSEFQSVTISTAKPKKKTWFLSRFIILLVLVFVIFSWVVLFNYYSTSTKTIYTWENWQIFIPKWVWYSSLPKILNDQWFTLDENSFKIYTRLNPVPALQSGHFEVENWMTIKSLIESLKSPKPLKEENITILEGWSIYDIDNILTKKNLINSGDFYKIAETKPTKELVTQFPFLENARSLEWFLYPDTYSVLVDSFTVEKFLESMLKNFNNKIYKTLEFKDDVYETIILASIVENEERNPNNKAMVAGILKNRIEANDFIWADITVCYPYKTTYQQCTWSFIVKHLYEVNDYNTRAMAGLPKTPIWNPQKDTIESTINSEDTDYYFYLHDRNGIIRYSRTLSEHNYKKQKYLR